MGSTVQASGSSGGAATVEGAATETETPSARAGLSALGVALGVTFAATIFCLVLPTLLHSGDVAVLAHGIGFLATGGLVVGGILYGSTLPQ